MVRVSKLGPSTIIDVYVLVSMPRRGRERWTFALPLAAGHRAGGAICLRIAGKCVQQEILLIGAAIATAPGHRALLECNRDRDGSVSFSFF